VKTAASGKNNTKFVIAWRVWRNIIESIKIILIDKHELGNIYLTLCEWPNTFMLKWVAVHFTEMYLLYYR